MSEDRRRTWLLAAGLALYLGMYAWQAWRSDRMAHAEFHSHLATDRSSMRVDSMRVEQIRQEIARIGRVYGKD